MEISILSGITMVILQVSSPSFSANGDIPTKFTCEGENISPALSVKNIPVQTKSLAVIVEDPEAPSGTVTHWVCWDIVPTETIPEKSGDGTQGKNTKGNDGYMGPCPPNGTHHYHFKIYALDKKLGLPEGASKEDLENAMKGHILGSGELVGLYQKSNK